MSKTVLLLLLVSAIVASCLGGCSMAGSCMEGCGHAINSMGSGLKRL